MSTSFGDIVTGALRRLRVVNPRKTVDGVSASEGMTALNDMMHSWKAQGVDVDHESAELADDFSLDDQHVQAVKALLAIRLASDYGMEINAGIARDAELGWAGLCADFVDAASPMPMDDGLTNLTFGRTIGTAALE